jgi:putative ABC transport system permease protein
MFTSYFKIMARLVGRQKTFTFLNVFGFAIGLTGFILIFLFIRYEFSVDKFHQKLDRLYLIVRDSYYGENTYQFTPVPYPFKDVIVNEFPEIEKSVRMDPWNKFVFKHGSKLFEEQVLLADKEIFDMFTFNLLEGDKSHPLAGKFDVAISKKLADKYFQREKALGKILQVGGKFDFTVSAVYEDLPPNSTLQSDIILPLEFLGTLGNNMTYMGSNACLTYLLLQEGVDVKAFEEKLKPRLGKEQQRDKPDELFLHPFKDYHLHTFHYSGGFIETLYIFSVIGFAILLLAGINYVNLVTAKSVRRTKEISIRKTLGAYKIQLIKQFLGESTFLALLALTFAILFVELTLPFLNPLLNKKLFIDYANPFLMTALIGFALVTGLIAGTYPAFYLARLSPSSAMKQNEKTKGGSFKSALVVFQFTVSIALIITSILLNKQFNYLINLPVGFDKDNIFYFKLEDEVISQCARVKKEFSELPSVQSISLSSHLPLQIGWNGGGFEWEGKNADQEVLISFTQTDESYLKAFSIPLVEGRYFNEGEIVYDSVSLITKVVINKSLKDITGFKDAVGKYLRRENERFEIIGVIEDFNFYGNRDKSGPLLITYEPTQLNYGFVKFNGSPLAVKEQLEKKYSIMFPNYPSNFNLINDWYERGFTLTASNAKIYSYFTALAVIISCLGLYGLASFIAEQRRKEIGIRKVMGATTQGLTTLLLKDFGRWLLFANAIAIPLAWYYSNQLLEKYTYRTNISVWIFVVAAILSILIAGITVFGQVFRTARQNPADVLKCE